jgi:S1-C subfamily serine protease
MPRLLAVVAAATAAGCAGWRGQAEGSRPEPTPEALRRTPLVDVFERCKGSVVRFTARRVEEKDVPSPDGKTPPKRARVTHTQWGSGCVLHEDGYVLSNSHMLKFQGARTASLADGKSCPVRVIAMDELHDLVLLKVDAGRPLVPLRLGRSSEVMVGEQAITIGNPFGIGLTMAAGIVSGVGRATTTEYTHLTDMIQTDASINPGSSGGPLVNILGEVIGMCTSRKTDGENIGFAIPIDKVRALLPELVAPEDRYGFVLGLTVATGGVARVAEVAPGSPAEAAGIQPGDVVVAIDGRPVRHDVDFALALIERQGGQSLPMKLLREGLPVEATVTLGTVEPRPADDVEGLVGGLHVAAFRGMWKALPDFAGLKPAEEGTMPSFGLGKHAGGDGFALRFTGYLAVPADGVYAFYTRSDDGSRLWIGGRLVVDNDGLHPTAERRGFLPLKAGVHRITVAFFEATGDEALEVLYEGPGTAKQPVPAKALFHRPSTGGSTK